MSDAEAESLYSWDGPPLVRLWGRRVRGGDGDDRIQHWLQVGDRPGAVVIAESEEQVLFVSVRRPAAGERLLELPRGFGDPADGPTGAEQTVLATAMRELCEETGFVGSRARVLGSYVIDSAVYPATTWVVVCDVERGAAEAAGDGEVDGVSWVPAREVDGLLRNGAVRDAHSLSALALWRAA
ncbi:hypothetical protein GCM10027064_15760 [Microbacterium petrolearium]